MRGCFPRLRSLGRQGAVIALVLGVTALVGTATAAGLLTGADIKNGSVTGKDIRNRSITAADLQPSLLKPRSTLPPVPGPAGPAGPTGPAGAPGAAGEDGLDGETGIVQTGGFSGAVGKIDPGGAPTFLPQRATVTVAAGQRLTGSASLELGIAAGGPLSGPIYASLCYAEVGGPVLGALATALPDVSTVRSSVALAGTKAPGPGEYEVGICVGNDTGNSFDDNGNYSGFVQVTN
jgi:hypothetical protein